MKKKAETSNYSCEFCQRSFLRESTIAKHICEYKHRWFEKDKRSNQIGFQAWLQFYKKNTATTKNRTYLEFIKSSYYTAFIKFGLYCTDANVLNVSRFVDWLLKNKVKIDQWNTDTNYTKFLISYLREEDPLDAIKRSVETSIQIAENEHIQTKDVFRYGNVNKICYNITVGKISPWILYQSITGKEFLDKLDQSQIKMVIDYINPEQWAIKFKRNPEKVKEVKDLLNAAGY